MKKKKQSININQQLLGSLLQRQLLSANLGSQYHGQRDIYRALGYPKLLSFSDYYSRYTRQDIAAAIIDRPTTATWKGLFKINSSDETVDITEKYKELNKQYSLKDCFLRADKLAGLGEYAIIYLGFSDVTTSEVAQLPISSSVSLAYVKPFSQANAEIHSYVTDPTNERYGKPLLYKIKLQSEASTEYDFLVHYSRCIHITQDLLEDDVLGTPRLQKVYNRLLDIEKLVGGSAEMFWRGARPGMQSKVDKDYTVPPDIENKLQTQLQEYENDLRRLFTVEGIELKELQTQVSDPSKHVDIQIQMISAETGIPKRILVGSERGELSSSQDKSEWLELIQSRREEFAEVKIINPFINLLQEVKILPDVSFEVEWPDLFAQSEKDKADVTKVRMEALKIYTESPIINYITFEVFLSTFLKLDDEVITKILEQKDTIIEEEEEFNKITKEFDE